MIDVNYNEGFLDIKGVFKLSIDLNVGDPGIVQRGPDWLISFPATPLQLRLVHNPKNRELNSLRIESGPLKLSTKIPHSTAQQILSHLQG